LWPSALRFRFQNLAGAGNGISLLVKKVTNLHNVLDILTPIQALTCAALSGSQLWKFTLPKAQYIRRQLAKLGYFADTEVQLARNYNLFRLRLFSFRYHSHQTASTRILCRFLRPRSNVIPLSKKAFALAKARECIDCNELFLFGRLFLGSFLFHRHCLFLLFGLSPLVFCSPTNRAATNRAAPFFCTIYWGIYSNMSRTFFM